MQIGVSVCVAATYKGAPILLRNLNHIQMQDCMEHNSRVLAVWHFR
jgi:hypothetical protein